jgi:hypothetical protein
MADGPSYRLSDALVESLDNGFDPLRERLADLGDVEYLWEPAPNSWTLRPQADGTWHADWASPDPEPAPVTTIAWRIWHLAVDCFASYSSRLLADTGTELSGVHFVGDAATATAELDRTWSAFRNGVAGWGEDLWVPLGPDWGPYAQHARLHLALHATREVIHHAAEIALLRDLYRATVTPT